jgi:hypothetical protein
MNILHYITARHLQHAAQPETNIGGRLTAVVSEFVRQQRDAQKAARIINLTINAATAAGVTPDGLMDALKSTMIQVDLAAPGEDKTFKQEYQGTFKCSEGPRSDPTPAGPPASESGGSADDKEARFRDAADDKQQRLEDARARRPLTDDGTRDV